MDAGAAAWRASSRRRPGDRRAAAAGRRRAPARPARARAAVARGAERTRAELQFLAPLIEGVGGGRTPRYGRGADHDRRNPGQQPARPVALREARLHPAQVPPDRRSRAVCAARDRRRRGRENRLRLALADGFLAAGDQARALAMVEGMGTEARRGPAADRRPASRRAGDRQSGQGLCRGVDRRSPSTSTGSTARRCRSDWSRSRATPIPQNSARRVLLALLLEAQDRRTRRWPCCKSVPADDPLIAAGSRCRGAHPDRPEALRRSLGAWPGRRRRARRGGQRLRAPGRLYSGDEAIPTRPPTPTGAAIALARAQGQRANCGRCSCCRRARSSSAGRWPEAKQALQAALALAPTSR